MNELLVLYAEQKGKASISEFKKTIFVSYCKIQHNKQLNIIKKIIRKTLELDNFIL